MKNDNSPPSPDSYRGPRILSTLLFLVFLMVKMSYVQAQNLPIDSLSNWRQITINTQNDTIQLDSFTVLPATLSIKNKQTGELISDDDFEVQNNLLIWQNTPAAPDGLELTFRILPYNLGESLNKKDTTWIGREDVSDYIFSYEPYSQSAEVFDFQGLDYNGSFARGISFGNNQDLVLNSSFNLQLAGDIGDDIEILAAISDNNIPLQPEGNTRQLQEFDQVFIQLKKDKSTLLAGDYQISRPKDAYFMNYYRRLQGLSFDTGAKLGKGELTGRLNGAVSRGLFARNQFPGQEGNQGPYKLTGANNERFLIVLAGTEKVYIDGFLLQRGSEDDYVIDYNAGEITFTANKLITKDSRIVVEFTYSTDNYLRTIYGTGLDYKTEKLNLRFNLYSEQDAKNQSTQEDLTVAQRQLFIDAGDDVADRLFPSIDTLEGFDANRIMYRMVDSLVSGVAYDSIFVYTTNPDSAKYVLRFTELGAGQGNYIPVQSSANGRIYAWVAPDLFGNPQGTHEPVIRLVAPQRKQLFTIGGDYQLTKNSSIMTELALSNTDLNTFSDLDADDNNGLAVRTGYVNKITLGKKIQKDSTQKQTQSVLETFVDYEYADGNFRAIDPYRAVEFLRDWNTDRTIKVDEHVARGGFNLYKKDLGNIKYELGTYLRDSLYTGLKHAAQARIARKGFEAEVSGSYLTSSGTKEDTRFFRPKARLSKTFKELNNWQIGVYGEREDNRRFNPDSDTLLNSSFYFDIFKAYLKSGESNEFSFGTEYTRRFDYAPDTTNFALATVADEINVYGLWGKYKHSKLRWNLTYRNLEIQDSLLTDQRPQETYLGRLEYLLNIKGGLIRGNTVYELGSGQQQRIEYTYVQVNPGEGSYTWIDRNEDGVKQLDEFEIANFQDNADHIRVTTFTNDFIRSDNVNFSQSIGFNPVKIWRNSDKKVLRFFSKFATQSTLQITRKTLEAAEVLPWNPFQLQVSDSSLVSLTANIRNTIFFNRLDPKYGFEVGMQDNRNRLILTTGYEARRRTEQSVKARWNPSKKVGTKLLVAQGSRYNDSEFFQNKDYDIQFFSVEPELTLLFKEKHTRIQFAYAFSDRKNRVGLEETALSNDVSFNVTYNKVSKSEIRSGFSFVNVNYSGQPNTPVEYAMLEGLQNGKNYLWNLTFERRIARNVLMNISYEGRKTGMNPVVHIGRASVRATF